MEREREGERNKHTISLSSKIRNQPCDHTRVQNLSNLNTQVVRISEVQSTGTRIFKF